MKDKKILYLIVVGFVAVILLCVLLAGLIDGFWPWQNDKDMGGGYTGTHATGGDTTDGTNTTNPADNKDSTEDGSSKNNSGGNKNGGGTGGNSVIDDDFNIDIDADKDGDFGVVDFDDLLAGADDAEQTTPSKPAEQEKSSEPTEEVKPSQPSKPGGIGPADVEKGDINVDF